MKASFTIEVDPKAKTVAISHLDGTRITTLPYEPAELQVRMMWRALITYAEKAVMGDGSADAEAKPNGKKKANLGDVKERVAQTANRGMDVAEKFLDSLDSIFGSSKK